LHATASYPEGASSSQKKGPQLSFRPTAVGYFVQGGGKFAGYEFWKKRFVGIAGDKETAVKYRTAIYLGAASVGESVSCDLYVPNRESAALIS